MSSRPLALTQTPTGPTPPRISGRLALPAHVERLEVMIDDRFDVIQVDVVQTKQVVVVAIDLKAKKKNEGQQSSRSVSRCSQTRARAEAKGRIRHHTHTAHTPPRRS